MLRRIPEPAQSEDLKDYNGNAVDFSRISGSPGAEQNSAEPEPSSAEHFPIPHFWTQPSNGFQWILWCQGHAQTDRSQAGRRNSGTWKCHSGRKNRDRHPTQKDSESASSNSRKLGVAVSDHLKRPGSTFWRPRPRSSGKCRTESCRAPERAPASFRAGSERGSGGF